MKLLQFFGKLTRFFGFPFDWYPVWVAQEEYEITIRMEHDSYEKDVIAVFEIEYSPFRNDFRLKLSSSNCKQLITYVEAVEKLNEFKNGRSKK